MIPRLFGTTTCYVQSGGGRGEKIVCYSGLSPRIELEQVSELNIPPHCTASTNDKQELEIACWREHIVNNQNLKLKVVFGPASTTIQLRDASFPLSFLLPPNQKNIDGMIFIMGQLKVCQGYLFTDCESASSIIENWSSVLDRGKCEVRVRSPKCKNILSIYSTVDHCQVCLKKGKVAQKRKINKCISKEQTAKSGRFDELTKSAPLSDVTNVKGDIKESANTTNQTIESSLDQKGKDNSCLKESQSDAIDELLADGAPTQFKLFIEMQLQNSKHGLDKRQRKWDPEFISFCLGIYVRSPKVYSDLRNSPMLILPSESLLRMYKNCIKQKPGINEENLTWMKKEAERQNVSDFGRRGGFVIDEMSIQDDLQVVRKGDAWSIVGGVDMGNTNNMISIITNKGKKTELATHCLQFIFRGFGGFRWPVAYFGSNPATAHQLFINFWECLDALDENGFTVDYVTFDGASTNRSFMKMLFDDDAKAQNFAAKDIYNCDHKVFVIQDIKHVIKKIRNSYEASRGKNKYVAGRYLIMNGKPVVWDHIEEAYNFNTQQGFRIHRHLTKEHIDLTSSSKMRNKLAEQVLDKDMLFLMKSYQATLHDPERLSSTVALLENTSVLVEIFRDRRPISEPSDGRLQQLEQVLQFFNTWEENIKASVVYTSSKNLFTDETREDLNSSITGFTAMCKSVLGEGNSITPAFINSDIVENHFCQQRGICNGLNTNPSLAQYGPSNTSICLSQSTVSSKSNSGVKAENYKATTPCPLNKSRSKTKPIRL